MPNKRKATNNLIASIVLGMLVCFTAGIVTMNWWQKTTSCYNNRPPLKKLVVGIEINQQQQLIQQFQKFADKNGFKFRIAYYTPNQEEFLIDLTREDIEVIASNPFKLGEFEITFNNNNCIHPTVAAEMNGLLDDLKSYIAEIPDAKITQER